MKAKCLMFVKNITTVLISGINRNIQRWVKLQKRWIRACIGRKDLLMVAIGDKDKQKERRESVCLKNWRSVIDTEINLKMIEFKDPSYQLENLIVIVIKYKY